MWQVYRKPDVCLCCVCLCMRVIFCVCVGLIFFPCGHITDRCTGRQTFVSSLAFKRDFEAHIIVYQVLCFKYERFCSCRCAFSCLCSGRRVRCSVLCRHITGRYTENQTTSRLKGRIQFFRSNTKVLPYNGRYVYWKISACHLGLSTVAVVGVEERLALLVCLVCAGVCMCACVCVSVCACV